MAHYSQQYRADMAVMQAAVTEHYLRVQDLCRWHEFDQAEQELERLREACHGMVRYALIMGPDHD